MPTVYVENFEAGLDTRKSRFTAPPGSLVVLKNAHITRGKEIERRKAFASVYSLPAGTFGLHAAQGVLYVFGSAAEPAGVPVGLTYQRLEAPDAAAMTAVLDSENFDGRPYVIAEYDDGDVYHFYDGVRVGDWDDIAADIGSNATVATTLGAKLDTDGIADVAVVNERMVLTATTAGLAFTVATNANLTAAELQAAVPAVPATSATADFTVTGGSEGQTFNTVAQVRINGVDLMGASIDWMADNATTAQAVADAINAYVTAYSASVSGATVTVSAPASLGAEANGYALEVVAAGDVTVSADAELASGADAVPAVPQITQIVPAGAFDAANSYEVTLDGVTYVVTGRAAGTARTVRAIQQKMYAVTQSLLYFSGFAGTPEGPDPTQWIPNETAGDKATGQFTITGGTSSAGVNEVTSVDVAGTELLSAPIDHTGDDATTAEAVAADITAGEHGYGASAEGATVTISAPAEAEADNGDVLTVGTSGDVTVGDLQDLSGGRDPADDPVTVGAGFINLSTQYAGSDNLVGVGVYQRRVAAFSRRAVQIWTVDPDPAQNAPYQVLLNVGAVAPRSIVEYGDLDIFFLSESGIRSLRARDSSNLAAASDVGVAIDNGLTAYMRSLDRGTVRRAVSVVEPTDGRYLMAIGSRVYVLSNFPGSQVSAWSTYDLGGEVSAWAVTDSRLYARIGDSVRLYGGFSGEEYDTSETEVVLPFLDSSNPAGNKQYYGLDLGLEGAWRVEIATEPNDPDEWEVVDSLSRSTYGSEPAHPINAESTHLALRLVTDTAGPARLGNLLVHYHDLETD